MIRRKASDLRAHSVRAVLLLATICVSRSTLGSTLDLEIEPYFGAAGWGHLKVSSGATDFSQPAHPHYPPVKAFDFTASWGLGFRLGAVLEETYFASLDFVQFPSISSQDPQAPSWSNTQLGITLGAQLPAIPMRFWIGFNFLNSVTPNEYLAISNISKAVGLQGTAFKIGYSTRIYSPVWLNFEMIYGQFSNYSSGSTQPLPSLTSTSYNYFLLSLSAPIRWMRI